MTIRYMHLTNPSAEDLQKFTGDGWTLYSEENKSVVSERWEWTLSKPEGSRRNDKVEVVWCVTLSKDTAAVSEPKPLHLFFVGYPGEGGYGYLIRAENEAAAMVACYNADALAGFVCEEISLYGETEILRMVSAYQGYMGK